MYINSYRLRDYITQWVLPGACVMLLPTADFIAGMNKTSFEANLKRYKIGCRKKPEKILQLINDHAEDKNLVVVVIQANGIRGEGGKVFYSFLSISYYIANEGYEITNLFEQDGFGYRKNVGNDSEVSEESEIPDYFRDFYTMIFGIITEEQMFTEQKELVD